MSLVAQRVCYSGSIPLLGINAKCIELVEGEVEETMKRIVKLFTLVSAEMRDENSELVAVCYLLAVVLGWLVVSAIR